MRKKGTLRIELKSDLCMSSGYSYASVIDSDICYDDCGLPYIPAKRMKGCIRESLEELLYAKYENGADILFGKRGSNNPGDMMLGNAYIEDYDSIRAFIKYKKNMDSDIADLYETQKILDRFSHVVGQTKLSEGVALKQTLRYTRVVDKISPFSDKHDNLCFEAEISCDESNWEMLKDAIAATKHIGLKRNRGMGNVRCKIENEVVIKNELRSDCAQELVSEIRCDGGMTVINYTIENIAPLMLSNKNEMVSNTYISGRNILGVLAARYLSIDGNLPEDETFGDLFLNGIVTYSNLYPSIAGETYYPTPDYINKLKKTGVLVNTLIDNKNVTDNSYNAGDGNTPKKLKEIYSRIDNNEAKLMEVKRDVVYHNSHRHKNSKGKYGLLYSMNVISPGQRFSGKIIVPDEYVKVVKSLLCMDDFYFGKSKSSEYGKCRLVKESVDQSTEKQESYTIGDEITVSFMSDTALVTEESGNYVYATDYNGVANALKMELHGVEPIKGAIRSTVIAGYISSWNLQRETIPAIAAGSYIVLRVTGDVNKKEFVGEYTSEGYGQIRIDAVNKMTFPVKEIKDKDVPDNNHTSCKADINKIINLMSPILIDDWLTRKLNNALNSDDKGINVSNSSVGRFTLMLKESMDEKKDNELAVMESFNDRIESIKRDSTKKEGQRIIKKCEEVFESDDNMQAKAIDELRTLLKEKLTDSDTVEEEINKYKEAMKAKYILTLLVNRKYEGRKADEGK